MYAVQPVVRIASELIRSRALAWPGLRGLHVPDPCQTEHSACSLCLSKLEKLSDQIKDFPSILILRYLIKWKHSWCSERVAGKRGVEAQGWNAVVPKKQALHMRPRVLRDILFVTLISQLSHLPCSRMDAYESSKCGNLVSCH